MKSDNVRVATDAAERPKLLRFLDRVGMAGVVIFAITVGIGVWSWLAYVVGTPQDFSTFAIVFLGVNVLGAAAQMILFLFMRPSVDTSSDTDTTTPGGGSASGSSIVFWGPTVVFGIVFLIVTPPGTSGAGFDPDMNIYQAMAIIVALSLIATALGSVVVFCVIILPLMWIVGGIRQNEREARDHEYAPVSGTQFISAGLIILAVVAFAVSLQYIAPDASPGSSSLRMGYQVVGLVTLQGPAPATIVAVLCIVAIVVLVIVSRRATAKQARLRRETLAYSTEPTT